MKQRWPIVALIGVFIVVIALAVVGGGFASGGPVSRPAASAAVPYSDEADYTALKTRTDCDGLNDLFLSVGREVQRDPVGSEARRWATSYWAAVGARAAELHCASR